MTRDGAEMLSMIRLALSFISHFGVVSLFDWYDKQKWHV